MKLIPNYVLTLLLLASAVQTEAQGTFQNLNFELANPGPLTPNPPLPSFANNVPVANALPYWSVFYGSVQQSQINVNNPSTGTTAVTLYTTGDTVLDGNYSVLLQGGVVNGVPTPASIDQTGLIPGTDKSLLFEDDSFQAPNVMIDNQAIPLIALGTGPNYTLYGGDISAFAGLPAEQLSFSSSGFGSWLIDDISFSQIAVTPEPSPLILTGIGGLLFATRKWFARR